MPTAPGTTANTTRTTVLIVIAAILWTLAGAAVAAVVARHLPDLLAGTALALAGTATLAAGGHIWQRGAAAAADERYRGLVEKLDVTSDLTPLITGIARVADRVRALGEDAEQDQAEQRADRRRLAALVEQLAVRVVAQEEAFEVGRRYQAAASEQPVRQGPWAVRES